MTIKRAAAALIIAATIGLSSCGSGGFDESSPAAAPSNDWDSMVWDQGKWG